jgi:hypothetical protein
MPQPIISCVAAPGPRPVGIPDRAAVRYRCAHRPAVRVVAPSQPGASSALVREISANGIWLLAGQRLEPGTALAIRPGRLCRGGSRALGARVAAVARQADGSWLLACRFACRLGEAELFAWFRDAS